MSTSSVSSSSSSSSTSGLTLSSLGSGSSQQITGLASGLDTDQIIQEEMSIYQQPVTNLQNQQNGLNATNKALTSIQSELQTLGTDAMALGDPSLFQTSQAVSSSDSTRVSASSSTGAGIGGYQVSVSQLANSAQRTFGFTSPTQDDSITIDNQQVTIPAGQSISDFVNSINANSNLDVYAAATDSGTVVLSNRSTGDTGANFIQVQDSGGSLTQNTALAKRGQDAMFSVDGVSGTSSSNTVTNAIAGVSLNLSGVTTTSGPVTVNVAAPAVNTTNISSALNTFITQYNKVIGDVQTQLSTAPSSSDPTVGTLYQDPELSDLLSGLRQSMYSMFGESGSTVQSMLDVGVSTGATTGTGAVSSSALSGDLQLDTSKLTSALTANPLQVQQMLVGFSASFSTSVDEAADPGGTIDTRVQGDDAEVTQLGNQISSMQSALTDKQNQLVQMFAQLESVLSQNQSTSSWLTSQIAQLPG